MFDYWGEGCGRGQQGMNYRVVLNQSDQADEMACCAVDGGSGKAV